VFVGQMLTGTDLNVVCIDNETNIDEQALKFVSRPEVVVANPRRLKELIVRKQTRGLDKAKLIVFDEADTMVEEKAELHGDVRYVSSSLPPTGARQSVFLSATLGAHLGKFAFAMLRRNYMCVAVGNRSHLAVGTLRYKVRGGGVSLASWRRPLLTGSGHAQWVRLDEPTNYDLITQLLWQHYDGDSRAVVFCHPDECKEMNEALNSTAFHSTFHSKHGENQAELDKFKENAPFAHHMLVTYDVMARGMNFKDVCLTVVLRVPKDYTEWIHMVGRAGRHFSQGRAVTFITQRDVAQPASLKCLFGMMMNTGMEAQEALENLMLMFPGEQITIPPDLPEEA